MSDPNFEGYGFPNDDSDTGDDGSFAARYAEVEGEEDYVDEEPLHHMEYDDPRHYSEAYYTPAQSFELPPLEPEDEEDDDEFWRGEEYVRYGSPYYSEPDEPLPDIEPLEDEAAPDMPVGDEGDDDFPEIPF